MTDLRTAAQQALEFCEFLWREVLLNDWAEGQRQATEAALEAALAEPQEPEPVAYVDHADGSVIWKRARLPGGSLLYTSPPQPAEPVQEPCNPSCAPGYCYCAAAQKPQRKPLTEEGVRAIMRSLGWDGEAPSDLLFARAVERAHGIGGEG